MIPLFSVLLKTNCILILWPQIRLQLHVGTYFLCTRFHQKALTLRSGLTKCLLILNYLRPVSRCNYSRGVLYTPMLIDSIYFAKRMKLRLKTTKMCFRKIHQLQDVHRCHISHQFLNNLCRQNHCTKNIS